MTNVTPTNPQNFGPPSVLAEDMDDDVLQGTRSSFASLAMPSKNEWAIRYQRMDKPYRDEQGNNIPFIEVAIIKSRVNISHSFYPKYEADVKHRPPDCWSSDGLVPDQRVPEATRQNPVCEGCPQKKPGSAFTATGDPTTACKNVRKIALIPMIMLDSDRTYEEYGGPMLYTITPTSLKNYSEYIDKLKAMGHKAFTVITRMRFDPNVKHQKIIFSPYRKLDDEEMAIIKELRDDPRTSNVLNQEPYTEPPEETGGFEAEQEAPPPKPTPKPSATATATATATPAPKPYFKVVETTPPPAPQTKTPTPPPPPKPGGFAATPQTIAEAVNSTAPRPSTVRHMAPVQEENEPEEELDEGVQISGLEELDDDLKGLLSSGD